MRRLISGGSIRRSADTLISVRIERSRDTLALPLLSHVSTSLDTNGFQAAGFSSNASGGFSALIATRTRSSASSRGNPAGIVSPIL